VRAVRRAVFGPGGDLFVADRDSDSVKRYDGGSGALRQEYRHPDLTTPVHLLFHAKDSALLVGSRDRHAIVSVGPESGAVTPLIEPGAGGLQAPAGMALGPDGNLYVCSRETRQILRFDLATGKPDTAPFITNLDDSPEFVSLVH
jgi:streptogramin lyase